MLDSQVKSNGMTANYRSSPWLRLVLAAIASAAPAAAAHVWEKQELTLTAAGAFANPYTDVTVWVDLAGPNFHKRVYGFWDGGRTFRVRLAANAPGDRKSVA